MPLVYPETSLSTSSGGDELSPVSVSLSCGSRLSADPTCQPLSLASLIHCVTDPVMFLKIS